MASGPRAARDLEVSLCLMDCCFPWGFALGEGQAGRVEERSEQGAGGVQRDAYFGAGKFIEQSPVVACRDNQALAA